MQSTYKERQILIKEEKMFYRGGLITFINKFSTKQYAIYHHHYHQPNFHAFALATELCNIRVGQNIFRRNGQRTYI